MQGEGLSLLLGYTSIACWLGAQFPQIIVNWRRKSVDGLALPFLANWLLGKRGDTTNLIGCLLTDQLPFQTYLATYFVLVDICLVSQFLHYDIPRHTKALSIMTSPVAHSRASLVPHSPESHTYPRSHISRPRSRSYSVEPHLRAAVSNRTSELDHRFPDVVASEVDIYDFPGWRRGPGRQRATSLEGLPESVVADPCGHDWGGRRFLSLEDSEKGEGADAEESESVPSGMIDSFHSEDGGRGRGKGKHVSWRRESTSRDSGVRRLSQGPPSEELESSSMAPSTVRGRPLTRISVHDSPIPTETSVTLGDFPVRSRRLSTASAVSVAASRRSASIVFLGVFILFGLSSRSAFHTRHVGSEGSVLPRSAAVLVPDEVAPSHAAQPTPLSFSLMPYPNFHVNDLRAHMSSDDELQRLVGRISAWTCTTLYLTSRLPQIWKNFVRKSVEGLSMYLFAFAFLGNFFYVLSILTSPKMGLPAPQARQFLRDSVPYLLGSGGTLLFDITIILQSFVYAPSRRKLHVKVRRRSLISATGEEERRLLATDLQEDHVR